VIGHNLHTVVPVAVTGVEAPGWRSDHNGSQREQGMLLWHIGWPQGPGMPLEHTGWQLGPGTPLEHTGSQREQATQHGHTGSPWVQDWLIGHTGLQAQALDTLRIAVVAVAVAAVAGHTRSVRIHQVRRAVVVVGTTVGRSTRDDSDGGVAAAPRWHCNNPPTAGRIRAGIGLDRLELER
jgi:hypothetical protein